MPEFTFTYDLATITGSAIRVLGIVVGAFIITVIARRVLSKVISIRMPKIREESEGELALRSDTVAKAAARAASLFVWTIAAITILAEMGVDVGALLATVGVASIAIGFAAQNIIRDFLHGFFIIMEDWYRVGEVANVAGIGGLVVDLNLRRTVLRDLDGVLHNIPNSKIETGSNLTRDYGRVNLNVEVAYGEDLDRVIAVINDECCKLQDDPIWGPELLTLPKVLRVDKLGASGVELKILGDTKPIKQWDIMGQLRLRLKNRFDEEGIEIPWPHSKVYFGNGTLPVGDAA